jgi:transposase
MTKQIEVVTSVQRRRRWPRAEKERIVAAAMAPGAVASAVARAAEIHVSQLFRWRQQLCNRDTTPAFAAVTVAPQTLVGRPDRCRDGVGGDHGAGAQRAAAMIGLPTGARVWLATGHTDMRKGFDGLALLVQEKLARDPHGGHLFVFRGRRGSLIKVLWHDGQGMCLYAKRLERGRFIWPSPADGAVTITPAQLGYLLEGIDWRMPQQTWRPQAAG